jgi:hypothetical protein
MNKNTENYYEKLKREFNSYNNWEGSSEYMDIERVYKDVKEYYNEKIKNEKINLGS